MSVVAPAVLADLARAVAEEAGALLLGYARRLADGEDLGIGTKTTATDLVSEADRASERLIAQRLAAARPGDGFVGEEGEAARSGSSGLRWVVDPLDGTVNFLHGIAAWCVSIAVEDDDGPVAGVVRQPTTGDSFVATRGEGAWLGERALRVSDTGSLDRVLLATGFGYDPAVRATQGAEIADLLPRVRDIRRAGAAALDLAWCASGNVDAYYEVGLQPWDWAAGRLLVTEAGGVVTAHPRTVAGHEVTALVAGGPAAHDALAAWLAERVR